MSHYWVIVDLNLLIMFVCIFCYYFADIFHIEVSMKVIVPYIPRGIHYASEYFVLKRLYSPAVEFRKSIQDSELCRTAVFSQLLVASNVLYNT